MTSYTDGTEPTDTDNSTGLTTEITWERWEAIHAYVVSLEGDVAWRDRVIAGQKRDLARTNILLMVIGALSALSFLTWVLA